MTKYKLAFVIERYFEFGGLQRDMRRFALACVKEGHDVTVFTGRWDGPTELELNVQIIDFKACSNHQTVKNLENFVQTLKQKNEFDCITGFNRVGGLDVYFCGDICLKAKMQQRSQMWRRFLPRYRTYLQLEAKVFGPTSQTELMLISPVESETIQRVYQTDPKRVHLLPPGIDRNRLLANALGSDRRNRFRKEFGVQDDDLLILTVGSSFGTKGIDRVIHAIARLPDGLKKRCHYLVIGRGDEKKFKAVAQKNGIGDRVCFTGGRQDVANFYMAADLLVHPARTETSGSTLLEAMVTGLAVIVTENCGYADYIRQADAGQVCQDPYDQEQLNNTLNEILANNQRRIQCGNNAFEYCKTADIYSMIEEGARVIINRAEKNRGRR
jgi:UDP-glucose:(heptosyl)LPS alpha-1,3-glucosyltransferase